MISPIPDDRTADRCAKDEQIAAEAPLAPLVMAPGTRSKPVEHHFASQRRPIAVTGVVENGLVRPLDPTVKLSERSRVIIVASEVQ